MPMSIIWEVTAYGDTVYVEADSIEKCQQIIADKMGAEVVALCTYKALSALPDGEELLN